MNGETLANLAYAAGIAALGGLLIWLLRDDEKPTEAERAAAARKRVGLVSDAQPDDEWVYTGPDSLRLLEVLDEHLDAYVLGDPNLLDRFHPEAAAGLDRLRKAVRDEQQKGEQE